MTTGSRPRFSVRTGLAAAPDRDGPFDDVPAHLLAPLQKAVRTRWHRLVQTPAEPTSEPAGNPA
ncbi:hypothetical protein [Streptomyces sp. NPDC000229]|uniref:hypothetical protein n=1 Tax=Streptomyces sp. NPDC000229 TaxID=3154247 RepID=UPI0033185B9E